MMFGRALFGLVLASSTTLASAGALAEQRLALVIGNEKYESVQRLNRAANDARAVEAKLKGLGFDVLAGIDLDRPDTSRMFSRLQRKIAKDDVVFLYYAGHGIEIEGENYLLPVDVPEVQQDEQQVIEDASFSLQRLIESLRRRGAKTVVVILDACRDNPFPEGDTRSAGNDVGLAPIAAPEGVFVMYSAAERQQALDNLGASDTSPNSVFTRVLLKTLDEPGLSVADMAQEVRGEVRQLAQSVEHEQTPAYYDRLTDRLVLKAEVTVEVPAAAPAPAGDRELVFWQSVVGSQRPLTTRPT